MHHVLFLFVLLKEMIDFHVVEMHIVMYIIQEIILLNIIKHSLFIIYFREYVLYLLFICENMFFV